MVLQRLALGQAQGLALQHPGAVVLVVLPEDRPAGSLGIVRQEIPAAVPPRQVHRRVAPCLFRSRRGCPAGLHVGVVGTGQAQVGQALLAALQHPVQRGQVLAVLDGVLGTLEYLLDGVVGKGVQPELLDLLELLGVRVGRVVLVVVVQPEQGEYLVDRLDPRFLRGPVFIALFGASLPRRCR